MKKKDNLILNVPDSLTAINETSEGLEVVAIENRIACMLASPIMLIGAIANFIYCYSIQHNELRDTLVNSLTLLVLGILYEVLLRIKTRVVFTAIVVGALYVNTLLFVFIRYYHYIGPAIWTIASIQMAYATSRIKRYMAIAIGTVTVAVSIYVLLNTSDYQYTLRYPYFITQPILLIFLIIVSNITHKINADRYFKLKTQLRTVTEQRNDMEVLYEEIAATEEELRQQNKQLISYSEEININEKKLHALAYYDDLTGLPNRKMFMEQLDLLIRQSQGCGEVFYVVFIDIDSFKKINDTMGHPRGDTFLRFAANSLRASINKEDILGRIGGDEFGLILKRNLSKDAALQEIEAIKNSFKQSFNINSTEFHQTASFGVSVFPYDGNNVLDILKSADVSMYKAKELGKNNVKFFDQSMQNEIAEKTKLENGLVNAQKNEELSLVFQPQYLINGEEIRGFEALLRWNSLELGNVNPACFIPIAEETGMIVPIGEWVLRTALKKLKSLQKHYKHDIIISVNVSTVQISDIKFTEMVKNILDETNTNPKYLELEVTESVFLDSLNQATQILNELKNLGVTIALDDFGTGYSSLRYLKLLPIDTLKIDKTFIDDISTDHSTQIVGDIISLGHNLGAAIVAEGIESADQLKYLREHSCDYVQGFLLNKPLDEEALNNFFKRKKQEHMLGLGAAKPGL